MRASLLPVLLAFACSDPADRYRPPPTSSDGPPAAGAGGRVDGSGGVPPGDEDAPSGEPGGGQGCRASDMALSHIPIDEGTGVTLSATIEADQQTGPVLIEVVRLDGEAPVSIYHFECHGPGRLELTAPPDLGEIYLAAFQDSLGDGPTADDPAGMTGPLSIGKSDIDSLIIKLAAGADLGKVALPHQLAGAGSGPQVPDAGPGGAEGDVGEPPQGARSALPPAAAAPPAEDGG